jgi:hypothetical protein
VLGVPQLDGLAPRWQHHKGHITGNLKTWKHHVEDQKGQRSLWPETTPWCLHCVSVRFRWPILIDLNGKLCILVLLRNVLLIPPERVDKCDVECIVCMLLWLQILFHSWCWAHLCMPASSCSHMITCAGLAQMCAPPSSGFPLGLRAFD